MIYDSDLPPEADGSAAGRSQYNHFYRKILTLPERMYTEAGRELAADRADFVGTSLDRFDREVAGDR